MDDNKTIQEAFAALREDVKRGTMTPEKQERYDKAFDAYENINQENVKRDLKVSAQADELVELKTAIEESSKNATEASERFDKMEVSLAQAAEKIASKEDYRETAEYKACYEYVTTGRETEALRTDVNTAGGFLVPSELDNVIVKDINEVDPMRSISRVRTLSGKSLDIPKRTGIPVATFEGEGVDGDESQSTYGLQSLLPVRQTFSTFITQDQLMDSAFNMEAEMSSDAAEAFALGAGNGYVQGNGVLNPFGLMQNADVLANVTSSGDASEITFAGLAEITGELEVGYNPVWGFNRKTLALIRALVSTTGTPILEPGINGSAPLTIFGAPYVLLPSMVDVAADSVPVFYGDINKCYTIADRTGTSVIRDPFAKKRSSIIEFTWSRWTTGDVVQAQACRVLKIEA